MAKSRNNKEIAGIFRDIAGFFQMENTLFKPAAYERAAISLEAMAEDTLKVFQKGGQKAVEDIPGVGESLAEKIIEYLKTGKISYYEKLKKKTPIKIKELVNIEGVGPKKVKILFEKLGVRDLNDLEKAARSGKIAKLEGFGEKSQKNILEAVDFARRSGGRFLLAQVLPLAREIEERIKNLKEVKKIIVAGSIRRRKDKIKDIDLLAMAENPDKVMDFFVSLPNVVKVWRKGRSVSSVKTEDGIDIDLRIIPVKSFGAALQYFTGSAEHNIELRTLAMGKGLKLNEYGLFRSGKMLVSEKEEDIYKALGLSYIEPELREANGEIEAARNNKLPKLIELADIRGDLHCHSNWDGGENSVKEMAETAMVKGYEYLGISDHTKFLRIENGLDEKQLEQQGKEIEILNKKFQVSGFKFQVLHGAETNILNDGSIDIKDEALEKLDYVIAGVHSSLKMPKQKMTERIIKAMKNPYVNIISHPTGRLLNKRDEYQIDFERILLAAKELGVILEINSSPARMDLNDKRIRLAKETGVKMIINTDSHDKTQLDFMKYGIGQARRGWAEKKDIVNTSPLEKMIGFFKRK